MKWIYLSVAIIAEVIATSALKESQGFTKTTPSLITILGYGVAFYFLSLTLKTLPIAISYAVWSGVGISLLLIIGYLRYGQSISFGSIIGILFIITGIILINFFSKSIH
tara:strand:- start:614 stop:940 length:327 start_codon:yes stop_codon:yes gene_type:complete